MDRIIRLLIPLLLLVLATGCSSKDSGEQMDYDAHKNMVMDILKSDDGKKALTENMKEDGMKEYEMQKAETGCADMEDRVFVLRDGVPVLLEVEDDAGND